MNAALLETLRERYEQRCIDLRESPDENFIPFRQVFAAGIARGLPDNAPLSLSSAIVRACGLSPERYGAYLQWGLDGFRIIPFGPEGDEARALLGGLHRRIARWPRFAQSDDGEAVIYS